MGVLAQIADGTCRSLCSAVLAYTCLNMTACSTSGPAHFDRGTTVYAETATVSSQGGVVEVDAPGSPIHGMRVEFPEGALSRETVCRLGLNDGKLTLRTGKPSGICAVLDTGTIARYTEAVKVTVRYDATRYRGHAVVLYGVDDEGFLEPLDLGSLNRDAGLVSFHTFKPVLFTWVYAPM